MAHVRTQLRNAVIEHLEGVFGESFVGDITRVMRGFQRRNLPFVIVDVAETPSFVDDNPPGHRVVDRAMTVTIRVAVAEDDENCLAVFDQSGLRIETALFDGSIFDPTIGPVSQWQFVGTGELHPIKIEDGTLIATPFTFTGTITTTDRDPETNSYRSI
ncbi:hypothetical protein ACCS79_03575 [Rhizobium johnstonii]|uniref:hypothetical protein n=1 Tax=Rhizobium johnstonii TaxID=3019933 RepID=UPI003F9C6642